MLNRMIHPSKLLCACGTFIVKNTRSCSSLPGNEKLLRVAIIGAANAGKSTLVNSVVGARVSAVTSVAHTTRGSADGVVNIDQTQIIFTDTPGAVSYKEGRRLKMHSNHIRLPSHIANTADVLAVVTDVSNERTRECISEKVLEIMQENTEIPAVLVMNKVDLIKYKENLIDWTDTLTKDRKKDEWGRLLPGGSKRFKDIFYTNSLTGEGVDAMVKYLLTRAKTSPWEYEPDLYSDVSVEKHIAEVFREKLLVMFGQEIPWQVKQETLIMDVDYEEGVASIHQQLSWPKKSQRRYVASKEEELSDQAREVLQEMFKCPVDLSLTISQKDNMMKDDLYYN